MQPIRKSLAKFATVAAISFMAGVAWANGPMIPYEEWDSKSNEDSEGPVCYLYIYPRKQQQLDFARGDALIFLSFNSIEPEVSEFAAEFGKSSVLPDEAKLIVADKSFDLVFRSGKAWLRNVKQESEVLRSFKETASFFIRLRYANHTVNDEYSSDRFAKAFDDLKRDCQMKS